MDRLSRTSQFGGSQVARDGPVCTLLWCGLLVACGRTEPTPPCQTLSDRVLAAPSLDPNLEEILYGGAFVASSGGDSLGRVMAEIDTGSGSLTIDDPVTPRGNALAVRYRVRNGCGREGTVELQASQDNGQSWGSTIPLVDQETSFEAWKPAEARLVFPRAAAPTWIRLVVTDLQPVGCAAGSTLAYDRIQLVDPAACPEQSCRDDAPDTLYDAPTTADNQQLALTGSWSTICGYSTDLLCIRGGSGAVRFTQPLDLQRSIARFRLLLSHPGYAAGSLSLALSFDLGLTFPVEQALPLDLTVERSNASWLELDLAVPRGALVFELRVRDLVGSSGALVVQHATVQQLGPCP